MITRSSNSHFETATSLALAEAEKMIELDKKYTLLVPQNTDAIEKLLASAEQNVGEFSASVNLKQISDTEQEIQTIFQYSLRTYTYLYRVKNQVVTPISSSYRDLNRSNTVTYSQQD